MTIKLSSLPPDIKVGDLIRATANVQGLQKGNYYYVVDIAKKEVIAAGGDKLPDDALFTDLVQTDFSDGDTGFPISKGAVRGEMVKKADKNHNHKINTNSITGTLDISKGGWISGEMGLKGVAYKDTLSHKNIAGNDQPNAHPMSSVNGVVHVLPSLLDKDLSNLDDPKEARDNLGLGSASVKSVGDFAAKNHKHDLSLLNSSLPLVRGGLARNSNPLGLGDLATKSMVDLPNWATSNHTHTLASTTGTLPISKGGTGGTTQTTARSGLGLGDLATKNLSELSFAASSHNHTLASTSGTLTIANGGTGATTAAGARNSLGLGGLATTNLSQISGNFAASSHNHTLASTTGTLPISKGGTGATTAANARTLLGFGSLALKDRLDTISTYTTPWLSETSGGTRAVALGLRCKATQKYATAIGFDALVDKQEEGVAVGVGVEAYAATASILGSQGYSSCGSGFVAGTDNYGVGFFSIVLGRGDMRSTRGVAIGNGAKVPIHNADSFAIGAGAATTAALQFQIGASANTSTVHSAVQVTLRSDERDKTDIQDSPLGTDFIKALRPAQWRWNYREYYRERIPKEILRGKEEDITAWYNENGLHKQVAGTGKEHSRFHNGFIAQEVKAVIDNLGIDFAGYQDASVQGSLDGNVRCLVYAEFIAPLVKTIQEQQKVLLEQKIAAQERQYTISRLRKEILEEI